MSNEKCPKCDSEEVDEGNVAAFALGYKSHKQGIFPEPIRGFKAKVCLECGYTEMYANIEKLKRKLKK